MNHFENPNAVLPAARTPPRCWTAYFDAEGGPWAVFLEGVHADLASLSSDDVQTEMLRALIDGGDIDTDDIELPMMIGHYWITDVRDDDDGEPVDPEDQRWHFCSAEAKGAMPITGVKF